MGCIHDEANTMFHTERPHRLPVHRSSDTLAVVKRHILLPRLRTVVIAIAALLQHLHGLPAFRRSSEYQYHR